MPLYMEDMQGPRGILQIEGANRFWEGEGNKLKPKSKAIFDMVLEHLGNFWGGLSPLSPCFRGCLKICRNVDFAEKIVKNNHQL